MTLFYQKSSLIQSTVQKKVLEHQVARGLKKQRTINLAEDGDQYETKPRQFHVHLWHPYHARS